MKKNQMLIIGLLLAAGIGFYIWNTARIKELKAKREALLNQYQQLPPAQGDRPKWLSIVSALIGLGKNVYAEFQPGGSFYKKNNDFSAGDLNDLINDPNRDLA